MCGRYAASRGAEELVEELGIARDATGGRLRPTWNAAPTSQRAVVRASSWGRPGEGGADPGAAATPERAPARELAVAGWGLVPFFAKDAAGGARMINARSETVVEKPAFRRAVRRSRVLVPVDGWYEWARRADEAGRPGKVAHHMSAVGGATVLLAGVAETWRPRGGNGGDDGDGDGDVLTFSILTRAADGVLAQVHDRTPVVVAADLLDDWLDPAVDGREDVTGLLAEVLGRGAGQDLQVVPVSPAVGSVRNDGPELVEPTGPPLTGEARNNTAEGRR